MKKKSTTRIFPFGLLVVLLLFISSCNKSDNNNNTSGSQVPTITTDITSYITTTTALSGGTVTSQGNDTVTARGVCWSTSQNPTVLYPHTTDGRGTGHFTSAVLSLNLHTNYYLRAYATNSAGTGYGNQQIFTTTWGAGGSLADVDGNVYHTVTIGKKSTTGSQVWMAENLKTTRYRDSTTILMVTDEAAWDGLTTPAYCWYNNDAASYGNTYGALYNFYAVSTGKLCPTGWHVPSDSEWMILVDYLGHDSIAGGKMKSRGTIEEGTGLWYSPNYEAANESGFTALPGGDRDSGAFHYMGYNANIWSSTDFSFSDAWLINLYYNFAGVGRSTVAKTAGLPVRCIKDN